MLIHISIAAAGFSIISLLLLVFQSRAESRLTKTVATLLLLILIGIQVIQGLYISNFIVFKNIGALFYLVLLGLVGPLFYLYSQHILHTKTNLSKTDSWHFFPVILVSVSAYLVPAYFNIAYSLMFLLGGMYMARLVFSLYQFRVRRTLFKMEFILTASFLSWAVAVVVVGIYSIRSMELLIPIQIIMLTMAVVAAMFIQLNYPHLLSSLEELASHRYQTTTLSNVDCDGTKIQLDGLMTEKKLYQDSELSLSSLAEILSLKPHQLSELINTQLGMSFSAYLRQQRVRAAELLLRTEPEVSVLAIGLSVGFSSQSAFYSAFKDIYATAPGHYRRKSD